MYEFMAMNQNAIVLGLLSFAGVCFGAALLLHIRKEPNDAHGKNRKFI